MKKFIVIDSGIDYITYSRIIKGRLTKRRYKVINWYCRIHSGHIPYHGCKYYCCWYMSSHWMTPRISKEEVYITYTVHYNY